ncbi:hypothetical protein EAI_12895 [Harpegnathos saltator]|uniref:Uncharacterized protein n=1 Tax=Harpegnathos saltator TaxID=610380 RepID=E2BAS0_HARSA|nr:hypothetical protein EAI_12895 [Harpegnathos saltator]
MIHLTILADRKRNVADNTDQQCEQELVKLKLRLHACGELWQTAAVTNQETDACRSLPQPDLRLPPDWSPQHLPQLTACMES